MISPDKLFQLAEGQKRRKLALTFGELERDISGIAEKGMEYNFSSMPRAEYTKKIVSILLQDPKLPKESGEELKLLLQAQPFDEKRTCNIARNALLSIIGTFPAEWDLIIAPHRQEKVSVEDRSFFKDVCVYAEDIRSPFNLGSIFRTAEGLGCDRVYISPQCVSPDQSKALRSGMGCIETMGYTRSSLEDLPQDLPVFVLETGGTPLKEFKFPQKGIVIIGSEELGVSPEALKRATYGRVTIPMTGLKASLNVGVAFGILMQAWVESLENQKSKSN